MPTVTEEDDILAAEYALGLLSPDEAAAAERRMKTDAPLSLRVAWWRDQLGPMVAEAEAEPPPHIWGAIEARLSANDNPRDATRPWKWATGGMTAVAAALLAVVALRPAPPPEIPPQTPLVASLSGDAGAAVTVAYEPSSGRMLVTPVALEPGAGDAELWIIPVGETVPVSMGVIRADGATMRMTPLDRRPMLGPGATFAISQEAKGGSPTGKAQGPIIATGKITRA